MRNGGGLSCHPSFAAHRRPHAAACRPGGVGHRAASPQPTPLQEHKRSRSTAGSCPAVGVSSFFCASCQAGQLMACRGALTAQARHSGRSGHERLIPTPSARPRGRDMKVAALAACGLGRMHFIALPFRSEPRSAFCAMRSRKGDDTKAGRGRCESRSDRGRRFSSVRAAGARDALSACVHGSQTAVGERALQKALDYEIAGRSPGESVGN